MPDRILLIIYVLTICKKNQEKINDLVNKINKEKGVKNASRT